MEHPQALHNGQVVDGRRPGRRRGRRDRAGGLVLGHAVRDHAVGAGVGRARPAPRCPTAAGRAGRWRSLAHPLAGVTIVEFGYFYAMPFGMTLAASLGARVIKLEPLTGDPMRVNYGIPEAGAVKVLEGKESIAVDLKTPEGRAIAHRLLERADVFAFGFRPQVAHGLGLDYETVRRINPRLVYLHASGYGVDGPYSDRPLYAGPAAASSGAYYRQAGYWLNPDLAAGASRRRAPAPRRQGATTGRRRLQRRPRRAVGPDPRPVPPTSNRERTVGDHQHDPGQRLRLRRRLRPLPRQTAGGGAGRRPTRPSRPVPDLPGEQRLDTRGRTHAGRMGGARRACSTDRTSCRIRASHRRRTAPSTTPTWSTS